MTLREVCDITGVSRRAIQGYEKVGLVFAVGKNCRGHLIYDDNAMEKIKKIKLFQEMGFSIKEIKELDHASDDRLKMELERRREILIKEKKHIDDIVYIMQEMIDNL